MGTYRNNIHTELPRWDAALAKLERELGPISETLKICLLRKNLGPTIQHYLRPNPDSLQDIGRMKIDLVVEWDRFNDFTTARPSGASYCTSAPIEIGATLKW